VRLGRRGRILTTIGYLASFIAAFLVWATAKQTLNFASVLSATVLAAVPLVLGALCGVMCERSGVINVAIEGQLLFGACAAAFTASVTGSLWAGLVAGCLAGALLGALLAVFAGRYLVQQVVLGVVLNLLAAGVTGFLYEELLQPHAGDYNKALAFSDIRIPGLASLPVVGPVLFDQNVIFYITIVLIVVLQVALFHTRWGLRTRAVGEHPTAADTVGIRVRAMRYRNVIAAGLISGLGGVWLTIGLNIPFNKGMSAGQGFIALAAVIFGRWSPVGALSAAVLFGFAQGISTSLQPMSTPVPTDFLSMTPYLATIFAVAGLVGAVRAPAAEGQPYTKQ
jgi:simple sugar transport system permease protein